MTRSAPTPDGTDGRTRRQISDEALQRLGDAIDHLAGDSEYIIRALTDRLLTLKPVTREGRLTQEQQRFLIESGTFTAETLATTQREVDRGGLQLGATEAFLSHVHATMSLDNVTGFLKWDEEAVRAAVSEGRLYAIEISGRLRFPAWQFDVGSPSKLLPGLTQIIGLITPRWQWQSAAGFMATPQRDLVARGRKTPIQWLRDGGDVDDVREIVEASDWS